MGRPGGRSSYRRSGPKTSKPTTPPPPSAWASSAPVESEPKSRGSVANVVADATTPAPASSGSSVPVKSEPKSRGFVANMVATVADGFIWATGNAMAHRAMDAIMGPRTIQIENVPAAAPAAQVASSAADTCAGQNKAFNDCINTSGSDTSKCQFYLDMLAECRKSGSATPIAVSF